MLMRVKLEMLLPCAARINKNGAQTFAYGAAWSAMGGSAAQHWGQTDRLEGKTCSHGRSFTNNLCPSGN
jgi:hypothetical protein